MLGEKFRPFWEYFDVTPSERRPLLPQKKRRSSRDVAAVEVDAIDQLEGLPILLARAVAVYTLALVFSTLLGAVRPCRPSRYLMVFTTTICTVGGAARVR